MIFKNYYFIADRKKESEYLSRVLVNCCRVVDKVDFSQQERKKVC